MDTIFLKCGCSANGKMKDFETGEYVPCCVIHKETEQVPAPDLTGRKASCDYCGKLTDSALNLPFFEHRTDREHDCYYCGCRGWN